MAEKVSLRVTIKGWWGLEEEECLFKIETQAEAKNSEKAELVVSHPLLLLASLAVTSW